MGLRMPNSQEPYRIIFFGETICRTYCPAIPSWSPICPVDHRPPDRGSTHFVHLAIELATADAGTALLTMLEAWDVDIRDIFARRQDRPGRVGRITAICAG
jgi:hypothetical protein